MRSSFYLFLFVIILIFSCTTNKHVIIPYKSITSEDNPPREVLLLEVAYLYNSEELLDYFFEQWYEELQKEDTVSQKKYGGFLSDVEEIFRLFYKPDTMTRAQFLKKSYNFESININISEEQFKNFVLNTTPFYREAEYIIVQDEILTGIINNFDSIAYLTFVPDSMISESIIIKNFRPHINYFNKKILSSTRKYINALNRFILGELAEYDDLDPSSEQLKNVDIDSLFNIIDSKKFFLSKKIQIAPLHWGLGYHYITMPIVNSIYFNPNKNKARVNYRDSWSTGGYAIYEKTEKGWELIIKKNTWIE